MKRLVLDLSRVCSFACRIAFLTCLFAAAALASAQADTGGIFAFGNLGLGQALSSAAPIRQVAAGMGISAALRSDGTVICWGDSAYGRCSVPLALTDVVQVACGEQHCIALRANGTVVCWGNNAYGQCTPPPGLNGVIQVAAGGLCSLALKSDGTVVNWGRSFGITNAYGVTQIAAGAAQCVALFSDGVPHAFGDNTYGESGTGYTSGGVGVTAFDYVSAILKSDGTIAAWGNGLTSIGSSVTGAVQISGPVALLANGTVANWTNAVWQNPPPPVPSGISGIAQIAYGPGNATAGHVVALKTDGTVVCWGDNEAGECNVPNALSTAIQTSSSIEHMMILRADHSVVCRGANTFGECNVPAGLSAVHVAAGSYVDAGYHTSVHSMALKLDGTVACWGDNTFGQSNVPAGLTSVKQIAAGGRHSAAL